MIILLVAIAASQAVQPDASRLAEDRSCYTITSTHEGVSHPIGMTWQTVERSDLNGRPVIRVTVRQSVANGAFDMRDDFILDGLTLLPLSLVNRRNGELRVTVSYERDRIQGLRTSEGQSLPIDVPLQSPVWEGNLFGLTFAALPLADGAVFDAPYWQYDKGFGSFEVHVVGSEVVGTPTGEVDAWVVLARAQADSDITYLIAKADHRELGYRAAQGGQHIGGDCSAIN